MPEARADAFEATRSALLVERDHDISMTLHYGHAELVVRRTAYNGGDRHDQAMFWIDVPEGGVAVGLRTLASLRGRPHWFDGELLEAELAAERYRELTGIGGYYPKDPALLSWRSASQLALQVFPCPPQQAKSVEYTMVIPATYSDGRYGVTLPAMGTEQITAQVTVVGASARDQVFVDGLPVGRGAVVNMGGDHLFELARTSAPTLAGGLAVVPISDDRVLFHYDIEAAPRLSHVPQSADVVVLLDRSRSLGEDDRAAEVVLARSYLAHFDRRGLDAQAAVIAFDRKPEDLLHGLVPAREATALLEHVTLAGRNGSHIDAALQHAERLFDGAKPGRARRIVLLTDRLVRSGLAMARLETIARRTGALIHVVDASHGATALERLDGEPWSALAQQTGGVLWQAGVDPDDDDPTVRNAIFEELARPLRIDELAIRAPGIMDVDLDAPATLDEGMGASAMLLADRRVEHVVLTGLLWAEPVRKVLVPDADQGELWSALSFGSGLAESLSEPDMMVLAVRGHAVSPVTSFLAIEPGVRPSTEGLDEGESGLGLGGIGRGGGGTGSGFGTVGRAHKVDLDALMRTHATTALQACGGTAGSAHVILESTFAEIVDVGAVQIGGDAVLEDCVREQLWGVELESSFTGEFATWDLQV